MNSSPPAPAPPSVDQSGEPGRGGVTDYDWLVDELAYTYEGIFSRESINQALHAADVIVLQARVTTLLRDLNI
jgi:hypothetical protein